MHLDPLVILQEVIDRDGDCEGFANPSICKRCPLGNKKVNGHRVNCVDYLNAGNMDPETAKEVYVNAAKEEIFAIELEALLSE